MFWRGTGTGRCEFCAEITYLGFERLKAVEERSVLQLFQRPALRDVLGAVPVEGCEVEE